jgi:hypothetical protein
VKYFSLFIIKNHPFVKDGTSKQSGSKGKIFIREASALALQGEIGFNNFFKRHSFSSINLCHPSEYCYKVGHDNFYAIPLVSK